MDLSIARWTQGLKYIQIPDTVDLGSNNSNEVIESCKCMVVVLNLVSMNSLGVR